MKKIIHVINLFLNLFTDRKLRCLSNCLVYFYSSSSVSITRDKICKISYIGRYMFTVQSTYSDRELFLWNGNIMKLNYHPTVGSEMQKSHFSSGHLQVLSVKFIKIKESYLSWAIQFTHAKIPFNIPVETRGDINENKMV